MSCSPDPINLAVLQADQIPPKPPHSFNDGAVGLGIVAAMSATATAVNSKLIAAPPRSEPIAIVSPRSMRAGWGNAEYEDDDEELSESYTCVISHVAGSAVRKRVYFDDGSDGVRRNYGASPGVFFPSSPATKAADLINCCHLRRKKLQGLDIFVYSEDKAFCSSECRCQQIPNNEYSENYNYRALKQFEYHSVSPCSAPLLLSAGVAAAY